MDKPALLAKILETLRSELRNLELGARASFAAATDPDSKAENKYDTRNLEASYIARGQARRVEELQESVAAFEALALQPAVSRGVVAVGMVAELSNGSNSDYYFVGPAAGGTEVKLQGKEILIITPSSPLGAKLIGRRIGESVVIQPNRPPLRVRSVS